MNNPQKSNKKMENSVEQMRQKILSSQEHQKTHVAASMAQSRREQATMVSDGNPFLRKSGAGNVPRPARPANKKRRNEKDVTRPAVLQSKSVAKSARTITSKSKKPAVPIPQMPIRNGGNRLSVNLVPEDTLRIVKSELPERLKSYVLMLVVLFASLLLAWGTLSWIQIGTFTEIQELKNDINQKEAELYRYRTQSAEVVKLQERYQVIEQLLADHIYWSKFFVLLEKYTLPNVYYTSFSVKSEPGARITLNARGRNVDAIAQQLKALQDAPDFADAVDINGFSMVSQSQRGVTRGQGSEEVSFDITLTLNKDVFRIE